MPLSEDEQRILNEIEENLSATDPKLVQQVSDTTLYRHAARVIKWSVVGFIAGLLLMIFTFTTTLILGILGFVVMLGSRSRSSTTCGSSATPGSRASRARCAAAR